MATPSNEGLRAGKCGICGGCDSYPPWSAEALKNVTPVARLALEQQMHTKQEAFRKEMHARRKMMGLNCGEVEDGEKGGADGKEIRKVELGDALKGNKYMSGELMQVKVEDPVGHVCMEGRVQISGNDVGNVRDVVQEEDDDIDERVRSQRGEGMVCKEEVGLEEVGLEPVVVEMVGMETVPLPRELSSRGVTLEDGDSGKGSDGNAESFHTADEEDLSQEEKETQLRGLELVELGNEENEDDDFNDWTGFKGGDAHQAGEEGVEEMMTDLPEVPVGKNDRKDKILVQDLDMEISTYDTVEIPLHENRNTIVEVQPTDSAPFNKQKDPPADSPLLDVLTVSMNALEPGHSLLSLPSENLEETVSARRARTRGHSRQNSSHFEEYALPPDLTRMKSTEISLESSSESNAPILACGDCKAWRGRVEELQRKVEELTSALAARDKECAALRAKYTGKVRDPARNEARLMQECESLRVTTEFLVSFVTVTFAIYL